MFDFTPWFGVILAVLFFWAVGAYNRLVRLRTLAVKNFAALDEQLVRQLVWVQGCLPEPLRDGVQTAPGELRDDVTANVACATGDKDFAFIHEGRHYAMPGPSGDRGFYGIDARTL